MVLNDEAHHCYVDRPLQGGEKADKEQQEANEQARVWFRGLQAIAKHVGHQADLGPLGDAVLPQGLRLQRGVHLPVDGQRLLADGRDRVGHRQGAADAGRRRRDRRARHLPAPVGLRRRPAPEARREGHGHGLAAAEGARRRAAQPPPLSYEKAFAHWEKELAQHGETPPVFIVVCPNTVVCKLVYDWIAGEQVVEDDEVVAHKPGKLALLSATSSTASRSRGRAPSSSTRRSSSPARG